MNSTDFYKDRNSRSILTAGRVLDPLKPILLRSDLEYASRYDGQVAVITAANLLSRMTPNVALDIPEVQMIKPLPWAGGDLRAFVLDMMSKADPHTNFQHRRVGNDDYVIHLGRSGAPTIAHGSGWELYLGPGPSPLPDDESPNPIGAALAAILSISVLFKTNFAGSTEVTRINAFDWTHNEKSISVPDFRGDGDFGNIWVVGVGSVGTATLFFLTLATRAYTPLLFDMDFVEDHNLDRSPIFFKRDVGLRKVDVTGEWLRQAGVSTVNKDPNPLDESPLWKERQAGSPDILIAAANERNVRPLIETCLPPIQIYGTTGKNWQSAMIRHIPMKEACSCCLFGEAVHAPTQCATGPVASKDGGGKVDAALPFSSFAAGAMAAAEILKINLPGFPNTPNRVVLNTQSTIFPQRAEIPFRKGCVCETRPRHVHRRVISGSRFGNLSI